MTESTGSEHRLLDKQRGRSHAAMRGRSTMIGIFLAIIMLMLGSAAGMQVARRPAASPDGVTLTARRLRASRSTPTAIGTIQFKARRNYFGEPGF